MQPLVGVMGSEGGGGPVIPAWVEALRSPHGDLPTIAADFKNGRYWGSGAETTAGALFVENANWGDFDPASIVAASGLGSDDSTALPTVAHSFLGTLLTTGFTAVITSGLTVNASTNASHYVTATDLPGYNNLYNAAFVAGAGDTNGRIVTSVGQTDTATVAIAATLKSAITVNFTTSAACLDGGTVVTQASASPGTPLTDICLEADFSTGFPAYMELLAIYTPQPDADLPTLSAEGQRTS